MYIFRTKLKAVTITSECILEQSISGKFGLRKAFLDVSHHFETHTFWTVFARTLLIVPSRIVHSTHPHSLFLEDLHLYCSGLNDQESNSLPPCRASPLSYSLTCPVALPRPLFNYTGGSLPGTKTTGTSS